MLLGSYLFSTCLPFLPPESVDNCPSNCYGNGDCISGTCHCFLGFLGPDCGRGEHCGGALGFCSQDPLGSSGSTFQTKCRTPGHPLVCPRKAPEGHSSEALQRNPVCHCYPPVGYWSGQKARACTGAATVNLVSLVGAGRVAVGVL